MNTYSLCRLTRIAALAAVLAPVIPLIAQDMQPMPRPPGGMRFLGTSGFIDYDRRVAPSSGPLLPLVMFNGDRMEPPEALLPGELQGRPVEINWALLDAVDLGMVTHCAFPLIGGEVRELAFVRKESFGETRYNWYGQIAGIPASDFILSRYDSAIVLQVRDYDRKERFEVRYARPIGDLPARSTLILTGGDEQAAWCGTGRGAASVPPTGGDGGIEVGGQGSGGVGIMSAADPTNVVDVLFIATNQFHAMFSNDQGQVNARAQFLVSDFNLTAANSNAGVTMRLAASLRGFYDEAASGHDDLANLANAQNGLGAVPSMRSMVRADHVVLLRATRWPDSDGSGNILGVAYRPDRLDTIVSSRGYSVVSASGSQANTFTHEIGHNFGACHDAATNASTNTCTSSVTTSPHGKRWSCNRGACIDHWHTTMAYGNNELACSGSTRVPFFSNPALTYVTPFGCSNFVLGDSISNVANMIQTTRSRVSQWQIGSTRQWTLSVYGGVSNGTYHSPFLRIISAVAAVQGGTAEGEVLLTSGTYNETGHNGGSPVLLQNPCVLSLQNGAYGTTGPALVR